MDIELKAEKIMSREIIRRLMGYEEHWNDHIYREIDILEARIKQIDKLIGEYYGK